MLEPFYSTKKEFSGDDLQTKLAVPCRIYSFDLETPYTLLQDREVFGGKADVHSLVITWTIFAVWVQWIS